MYRYAFYRMLTSACKIMLQLFVRPGFQKTTTFNTTGGINNPPHGRTPDETGGSLDSKGCNNFKGRYVGTIQRVLGGAEDYQQPVYL